MKQPSQDLVARIQAYAEENDGRIYAPILHPALAHIPHHHGSERFEMIKPHLGDPGGTALDIGSHWGYMAHRLEDMGYRVTAVEASSFHVAMMIDIRDVCGKHFNIYGGSIFDIHQVEYDLVVALNIFHHFLKKDGRFKQFNAFLKRLRCRTMIYQAHAEHQIKSAPFYMKPGDFARYIADKLSLPNVTEIGEYQKRMIYKLS